MFYNRQYVLIVCCIFIYFAKKNPLLLKTTGKKTLCLMCSTTLNGTIIIINNLFTFKPKRMKLMFSAVTIYFLFPRYAKLPHPEDHALC